MKKKIVLHVLSSHSYSGAENVVCQIVSMFRKYTDYEMYYASPDGPIKEALDERSVNFIPMKTVSFGEFRRVISELKPDIVHAHDMKASFYASLVCGHTLLISHIHNNSFDSRKITTKVLLYCIAAIKAKHIFWVSSSAYSSFYFRRFFEKKSSVLYNIIDHVQIREKAIQATDQSQYDVVYLGRLSYPKNPQRLICVLENVVANLPNVRIAIIGNGPMEKEIQTLVSEKGLCDNIHFLGYMSNPHGVLKNSKVMLMTSRWEGTPMCALEAMALGIPVVSTPTDGLKDVITHGINGYLSDEDEQLTRHIVSLLSDCQIQTAMSAEQVKRACIINDIDTYRSRILEQYQEEGDIGI